MKCFSSYWDLVFCRVLTLALMTASGCVTPFNTRLPMAAARPPEMERREAQIHDPYPDTRMGPEVGFRPLNYQEQRSEPQQAKDRFYTSVLRNQNRGGTPLVPGQTPLLAPPQSYAPGYLPGAAPGYYAMPTQPQPYQVVAPQPYQVVAPQPAPAYIPGARQ